MKRFLERLTGRTQPTAEDMLLRPAESFFDVPLFMAPGESLEAIRAAARVVREDPLQARAIFGLFFGGPESDDDDGICIVKVRGSLYRGLFWDDYEDLRRCIARAMEKEETRAVLLDIDSPGGRVAGCFDLTRYIAAQAKRKPIWALVNDQATSAAYAIASAAGKIYCSPSGIVGSIGALCVHVDESGLDDRIGVRFTEIASGQRKTDLSPHKALNAQGRATLARVVDQAAEQFFAEVASNRPTLTIDALRAQQAAIYIGSDAQEAGLIDGLGLRDEVLAKLREFLNPTSAVVLPASPSQFAAEPATGEEMSQKTPEATASPAAQPTTPTVPTAQVVTPEADAEDAAASAAAKFQKRARQITNACVLAGHPELAGQFIADGLTVAKAQDRLLAMRAEADEEIGAVHGQVSDAMRGQRAAQPVIDSAAIYKRWNDPEKFRKGA